MKDFWIGATAGLAATTASQTTSNLLNDKPFWEGVTTESLVIGGTVSMITTGLVDTAVSDQEAIASGVGGIMGSAVEEAVTQFTYVFDFTITTETKGTSSNNESTVDSSLETDKEEARTLPTTEVKEK